jgi:hypothetical protein
VDNRINAFHVLRSDRLQIAADRLSPSAAITASDFSERDMALIVWPAADSALAAAPPTKPDAPVIKMFIFPRPF